MDSKTLFAQQVVLHTQSLCNLLGSPTGERAPDDVMGRCLVGTRMLAGTSSLMEYDAWAELLSAYHLLLDTYHSKGHAWDERVAQVTSEVIEREEILTGTLNAEERVDVAHVIDPEELRALVTEINVFREECATMPSPAPEPSPAAAVSNEASTDATPVSGSDVVVDLDKLGATPEEDGVDLYDMGAEQLPEDIATAQLADEPVITEGPLSGVVGELRESSGRLLERFRSDAWNSRAWSSSELGEIRRELGMLDFYVRSVDRIIRGNAGSTNAICSLEPLRITLSDFASEIAQGTDRELTVELNGIDHQIDPLLLPVAETVLQSMVRDIFERCEGERVEVTVDVVERNGALLWKVSDDGNNFISDSRLDHEDQLAFYPGLRQVRRTLAQHKGVLSVEPGDGREARFEFTTPVSSDPHSLQVWNNGNATFGARSAQLCRVVPGSSADRGDDVYGDYIVIDHTRVPLLRLDLIYVDAPGDGAMIAILGSLEKRVGVFVPDCGAHKHGQIVGDSVPMWQGPAQPVALVEGERIPLLDADAILAGYLSVTGTVGGEDASGGVTRDELELSQSQAASADAPTPPDACSVNVATVTPESVEVLVVEQSESMRDTLTSIFSENNVKAAFVCGFEEAMELLRLRNPRLIISEFRMPTMAAKKLVDSLRDEGRLIPILVTTSQSGKTADLLVEKLGASGYLSKPLQAENVASQVHGYLGQGVS